MKQRGFSLIEIAIVLVVIGLLLSGILNAGNLVASAKAKDVVAIIEDLRTATTYFKQRYNYLPGDWPYTAGEINGVVASPGDGNGSLLGVVNALGQAAAGTEVAVAPMQLFNAGLIGRINNGDPLRLISTSYGSAHIVSAGTANGRVPGFAAANPSALNAILFNALPCQVAAEVDNKLDNNSFLTGKGLGTACAAGVVAWYAITL